MGKVNYGLKQVKYTTHAIFFSFKLLQHATNMQTVKYTEAVKMNRTQPQYMMGPINRVKAYNEKDSILLSATEFHNK